MKNPDDIEAGIREPARHEMRADGIFEIALPHINASSCLHARRQTLERRHKIVVITVGLFARPVPETVEPEIFHISDGERR